MSIEGWDGVLCICQGVSEMGKCVGVLEMRDLVLVCRVVLCTGECWGMRIAVR